jgi:SAM-dependent methyltransferase
MAYRHPLAFLLGYEGLALHRAYAGEFGPDFVEARLDEVRAMLAAWDAGDLGVAPDLIGEVGTVAGYRVWSATYDEPGNPLIEVEEPIVRELLAVRPPGRVLDAACGTGRYAALLAGAGHRVIGVDSSPDMLGKARAKVPDGVFALGELQRLPVPDRAVDLVVCALALPHVPALAPVFAEFARVLRPGGHLITSDIHWQSLYLGGIASIADDSGAVARMPAARLRPSDYIAAARSAGLQVDDCREPTWPPDPHAGGPLSRTWAAEAVDAACENTPAAIVWHFRMPG